MGTVDPNRGAIVFSDFDGMRTRWLEEGTAEGLESRLTPRLGTITLTDSNDYLVRPFLLLRFR